MAVEVPPSLLTGSLVYIVFRIFHPHVPASTGRGPDTRSLGLGVKRMEIG